MLNNWYSNREINILTRDYVSKENRMKIEKTFLVCVGVDVCVNIVSRHQGNKLHCQKCVTLKNRENIFLTDLNVYHIFEISNFFFGTADFIIMTDSFVKCASISPFFCRPSWYS